MLVLKVNIQKSIMRVLPVFLTFVVLVTAVFGCIVPEVSADDSVSSHGWINLLDYTNVESGSNFFVVSGTKELTVSLPYVTNLFYVDMVFYSAGSSITGAKGYWPTSGAGSDLEVMYLGNGLHRVYGSLPSGNYTTFRFSLTSSGTSYVTCQSLQVRTLDRDVFADVGSISLSDRTASMTDPMKPVYITASSIGTFTGYVQFLYWYKYDSVEYTLGVMTDSLGSIDAYYGNIPVPIDVSYIEIPDQSRMYYIQISVDVSGLDKELGYPLSIRLCGEATSSVAGLYLYSICGYVDIEPPSPLVYWFNSLFSKLGSWFNGVMNTVSAGFNNVKNWLEDGFQSVVNKLDVFINGSQAQKDTADQIQGAVDDYNDQMQGVNRPDVNDDQFDVDTVIGADNLTLSISLFASLAQNEVASSMIVIVVIFMLGSYVLFGKKA